jgi:uncharacterized membrane protein
MIETNKRGVFITTFVVLIVLFTYVTDDIIDMAKADGSQESGGQSTETPQKKKSKTAIILWYKL